MWSEIRISGLGVIDEATLELDPGFTVVTGETGAGKTMLVTAVGLLRGRRSDAALVRHGDPRARVEATVDLSGLAEVRDRVEDVGGDLDDDHVEIGRTVSAEGRSRAYVGGASVPASALAEVAERLVAVHGQADQHRLLRAGEQRAALDRFAGAPVADLLAAYTPAYARLRELDDTLAELTTRAHERARELDLLRFGLDEVAAVDPQPGEDVELAADEARLGHAESLARAALDAHELIAGDDDASGASAASGAAPAAAAAVTALQTVAEHDPALSALADRLAETGYVLTDLGSELASYARGIEVDPLRLATIQQRRADLTSLTRKYGATVDDVLAWAAEASARAAHLDGDDDRVRLLEAERAELAAELGALASSLSDARRTASVALAARVSDELTALAMPHARVTFDVTGPEQITTDDLGPDGADRVELLLAANAGSSPLPIGKGASGGELSRVMLALEVVLADGSSVPTMVFDEVDAGVGGRAAVEVGRRLAHLARHAQVVAVTHLPQVAAYADRHHRVVKSADGVVTTSDVLALDEAGRVAELSRMLAGLEGSVSAEAHARELLDSAAPDRASAAR